MKLGHDEIREMLPEYLRDSLGSDVKSAFEAHLKGCKECRDEAVLIRGLLAVETPDPGDLYWKTLPRKVRLSAGEEKIRRFSPKSFFRWLPAAATVALLFLIVFTFVQKKEAPMRDPLFKDPLAASTLDLSDITEREITMSAERFEAEELPISIEDLTDYSYHREFAYLNSKEMERLDEALKQEGEREG